MSCRIYNNITYKKRYYFMPIILLSFSWFGIRYLTVWLVIFSRILYSKKRCYDIWPNTDRCSRMSFSTMFELFSSENFHFCYKLNTQEHSSVNKRDTIWGEYILLLKLGPHDLSLLTRASLAICELVTLSCMLEMHVKLYSLY